MNEKIENLLKEDRKFPPSEHLVKNANAPSSWYDEANEDRLKFWQKQALTRICLLYTSPSPRDSR